MNVSIRCSTIAFAVVIGVSVGVIAPRHLAAQTRSGAPELNLAYERFTLDNGLRVIVREDRKAPVVAVAIWYHVGSRHEPLGQTGFAHLFEHLMMNGSEHHDGEWFEPLQRVGAAGSRSPVGLAPGTPGWLVGRSGAHSCGTAGVSTRLRASSAMLRPCG